MTNRKKLLLTLSMLLGLNTSVLMAELIQTQIDATLGIVTNFILDDGITHNGTTYKTVTSPYTGRVWLDRNLGASQVCTSLDDVLCYGDYYQWGRGYDGHQEGNSSIAATQAADLNSTGSDFIIGSADWASVDTSGNQRTDNWLKADGSSVCPVGFRVPTSTELEAETLDNGVTDRDTAFSNFLKLPSVGYRGKNSGSLIAQGSLGYMWSGSANGSSSGMVSFDSGSASNGNRDRAFGFTVRCIKGKTIHQHNGTVYGEVTSPYTGKVWLDRNLGASQVCTSFNDTACYGDYYQWGRNFDGHQESNSSTTPTQATDVTTVGHGDFITSNNTYSYDWAQSVDSTGTTRSINWSATDGSSVCPVGFRVPNITELRAETLDNGVTNRDTAFTNFLKLPSAGNRSITGSIGTVGSWGQVWSSSVTGSYSSNMYFNSGGAGWGSSNGRAFGLSVRCLRD